MINKVGLMWILSFGCKWFGWLEVILYLCLMFLIGKMMECVVVLFLIVFCVLIFVLLLFINLILVIVVVIVVFGLMVWDGILVLFGVIFGMVWIGILVIGLIWIIILLKMMILG